MVEIKSGSSTNLKGRGVVYVDNNYTNSAESSDNDSSSKDDLRDSTELSITGDTVLRQVDSNSEQYTHSIPITREALEENNSIIVTKQAAEDTMSSSPSSYASSRNIPISNSTQGNPLSIERHPSPLVYRESAVRSDEEKSPPPKNYEYNNEGNKNGQTTSTSMLQITNLINLPTNMLIKMVTVLLEKIIQSNDKLAGSHQIYEPLKKLPNDTPMDDYYRSCYNAALSFRGKHIPPITLEQYFHRIQKYCPVTNDVYLSLLIYFDRISKKCNNLCRLPHHQNDDIDGVNNDNEESGTKPVDKTEVNNPHVFVMDSFNIHRLIITAVTVSTKFSSDFFYSNSRYSKVGGISLKEMNYLEVQFLILCDFNLLISVEEFERYATLLYRFWDNLDDV